MQFLNYILIDNKCYDNLIICLLQMEFFLIMRVLLGRKLCYRKITLAVAKIEKGLQKKLILGNLNAKRDWGDAEEFVKPMWLILNHNQPDDFVISTGNSHCREFVKKLLKVIGINIDLGNGLKKKDMIKYWKNTSRIE